MEWFPSNGILFFHWNDFLPLELFPSNGMFLGWWINKLRLWMICHWMGFRWTYSVLRSLLARFKAFIHRITDLNRASGTKILISLSKVALVSSFAVFCARSEQAWAIQGSMSVNRVWTCFFFFMSLPKGWLFSLFLTIYLLSWRCMRIVDGPVIYCIYCKSYSCLCHCSPDG